MKLGEMAVLPPKVLDYGAPGSGKTVFAASLGDGCYYIDVDLNIASAKHTPGPLLEERLKIDWQPIQEDNPLKPVRFAKIKQKVLGLLNQSEMKTLRHTSVVLDSLTMAGQASLDGVLGNSGLIAADGTIKTKTGAPELQHWGLAMAQLEQVLLWLRALPIPVVVIGHQEMKPVSEAASQIELSVIGAKLAPKIPAYFTEVWYQAAKVESAGKISYSIRTKHTGQILARSCHNLPEFVDTNKGMWEIFKMIGFERKPYEPVPPAVGKVG